ncbi:MAG: GGDEF domain-containing protein [Thiohalocapsa sp.]|nr:GGDEF domain-containing protein [Thiohalocapsa sp.]MCF7991965.1 GGDEF domain-containing protein [Thiohalocapsa sp.]
MDFQSETLAAQVDAAYAQLPISLAVNVVNALLLSIILWPAVDDIILTGWLVALLLLTGLRYLFLRGYRRDVHDGEHARYWQRRFTGSVCAVGVVWGAAGYFLFPVSSFPHQLFLVFVLGGMVAGAVPLLSVLRHAYVCFAVPVVVPVSLRMVSVGDTEHLLLGAMILVFGLAMLASSRQVLRLSTHSIELRLQLTSSIETGRALQQMLRLDELTGIANRRLFDEMLQKEWRRARRENTVLSVITADIDHFKNYNDYYGHQVGDQCLINVATAMQRTLHRPGDVVARVGGEEFAFLLPDTPIEGATAVAELARRSVLRLAIPHEAPGVGGCVTVSFGVASSDDAVLLYPGDLVRASDEALYRAKRGGRNRVAVAGERADPPGQR